MESARPAGCIYLASDLHLGAPDAVSSRERERKLVRWLEEVAAGTGCAEGAQADAIHLVGDVFDFWFEYRHAVPKGGVRLMGAIARITDAGIPVHYHLGNHDLWSFGYLEEELGVTLHRVPTAFDVGGHRVLIGHGDGLGPGDYGYKRLKRVFAQPFLQRCFRSVHPDWGIGLAMRWSRRSRANGEAPPDLQRPEGEWIWHACKEAVATDPSLTACFFGHRHHPMVLDVPTPRGGSIPYINLGDWITHFTYGRFAAGQASLHTYP